MQRKSLRQMRMNLQQESYNKGNLRTKNLLFNQIKNTEDSEKSETVQETGLIVKIFFDEPISDAKQFKSQVKEQDGVSYVEAEDCMTVAFVRCTDANAAKNLITKQIWRKAEVLEGKDEKEYWHKIEENRVKKRARLSRPKKSGAERIRQKKETDKEMKLTTTSSNQIQHIRFCDEEACS